jgi:DNA-binding transcriptional LysR family regulator
MRDWDDFKFFSAVARTGSVRGAGKDLGVHASTVTRHLEQFERRLGTRLFARTPTGLIITPEGAEVVQALDEVAARLEGIERRLQSRDAAMAGVVRVNVPELFGGRLFLPEIGTFSRLHPDIDVEVRSEWQPPDLDRREGDLSVVLTDDPPGHLIGRPLGHVRLAAYRHVDTARSFEEHWLDSALERAIAPNYVAQAFGTMRSAGYLQSIDLQLAAARGGMGATLLPRYLGEQQGQLVRLTGYADGAAGFRVGAWLLSHPDSRGVARVQAVAELILDALRDSDPATDLDIER